MSAQGTTESGFAAFYLPIWISNDPLPAGPTSSGTLFLATQEVLSFSFTAGVRLHVTREGYFHFDFANHATAGPAKPVQYDVVLSERARFLNLALAFLYTEFGRAKKAVEHLFVDQSTIMSPQSADLDPLRAVSGYDAHQRVKRHREHWFMRNTFSIEQIRSAATAAESALRSGGDRDLLATMILQAFALHSYGQVEASLVTAWAVAERCLNELWDQYLEQQNVQGVTTVVGARRKKLGGIDFTASVVSEVLSLAGKLSHEDYEKLTSVRKKRNDWVHKLTTLQQADAAEAVVVAQSMLRSAKLLDLQVPFFPIKTWPLSFQAASSTATQPSS